MKKLSFKSLKLETIDQLQREELKTLLGGYGGSGGGAGTCKSVDKNSCTHGCAHLSGGRWYCSTCCIA